MLISLLILWTLLTLLAGTSALSIQGVSRSRLATALRRRGLESRMKYFDQHRHDYALTALTYRQLGIVLFVINLGLVIPAQDAWYRQPLLVLLAACGWFILFGAAIPSAWARYAGDAHLANVLGLLEVLRRITAPVLWVMRGIDEIVRRLSGVPRDEAGHLEQIEREILDVVSDTDAEGPVDETEKAMIKSVMAMDDTLVGQVMTPRTDVIGIEVNANYADARELALKSAHSRIPVFEETLDHTLGVLYAKDLLSVEHPADFSLLKLMRPIPFVPETKDLASLLKEFQAGRVHMAIVLDEYGGTAGLVTIEDILEELVGEIADEHDDPVRPSIQRIDDQTAEVDARVRVAELNETLDLALPEDESYDTIAGFVFSKLGKIPAPGESVQSDGVRIVVLSATDRSLVRLRLEFREKSPVEDSP